VALHASVVPPPLAAQTVSQDCPSAPRFHRFSTTASAVESEDATTRMPNERLTGDARHGPARVAAQRTAP
jgi:hypothetical protein